MGDLQSSTVICSPPCICPFAKRIYAYLGYAFTLFFRLFPGSWPPNKPINKLNLNGIKFWRARLKLHEIAACFPNTMPRMDKQMESFSAAFLPDPPGPGSFEMALAMGLASNFRNNQALQLKFLRIIGSLNFSVCNGFPVSVHLDARLSAAAGSDSLFPGGRPRVLFRGESFPCAGKIASVKILKRKLLILISLPPPTPKKKLYILKICQVNSISYKVTVNSDLRAPQELLLSRYIEKLPTFADQAEK